jgi:serine/threonine protein kinase
MVSHKTYEAAIDNQGQVVLPHPIACAPSSRALVVILEGEMPSIESTASSTSTADILSSATASRESSDTQIWHRRYKPLRNLASGMATVVLAQRITDGALVCLKFLRPGTDRRIFEQECRALMRLKHPAIVSLLDFSSEESMPWLATEYVEGGTIQDYLKENGAMNWVATAKALVVALQAVAYAHDHGVVHRDLKPGNIILGSAPDGSGLRLLDFGLALLDKYDYSNHPTGIFCPLVGTLMYMAPEQMEGSLLTPACDVYAMGLIGLEMLSGRAPFKATSIRELLIEKMKPTHVDNFLASVRKLPDSLVEFLRTSTQSDPACRPSARESSEILMSGG